MAVVPRSSLQGANLDPHLHPQLGVEVGQGFVEQKHLRLTHDRPAHRHPLPLPTRQRLGVTIKVGRQSQQRGGFLDRRINPLRRLFAQVQAEAHVLGHGHVRVERVVLEHHGDVPVLGRQAVDHPAVELDGASGDGFKARDHPQQG